MNKSIERFLEKGVRELESSISRFFEHPEEHGKFVQEVRDIVLRLGIDIVKEAFEDMDMILRESAKRRLRWEIVKKDSTALLTTLGNVRYSKTLYRNKETEESCYLLDRLMGMEPYARMTDDAEAAILEEAVETTYQKAGHNACISEEFVSKKTSMNKVHELEFPEFNPALVQEKRVLRYLYIDADEGHIPLQYINKKGDIVEDSRNYVEPRLVYVYEGVDPDSKGSSILINPRYFGGIYEGTQDIECLWNEIYTYIDAVYDIEQIEKIYVNSDAAQWIKNGIDYLPKAEHVLDEYHLKQYLKQAVYCVEDADDYYTNLYLAIKDGDKRELRTLLKEINKSVYGASEVFDDKKELMERSHAFLINNFEAAHRRLDGGGGIVGSSTEPHVSHVFAYRMSMKPMAWSKKGVDKMSRLLIYNYNQGDMLSLVRYQKQKPNKMIVMQEALSRYDIQLMEKEIRNKNRHAGYLEKFMKVEVPKSIMKGIIWNF
ncbi:ISLre2 family transposase [Roseburia hominis]